MKTKQIGVRFNSELLLEIGLSPQMTLNMYEDAYIQSKKPTLVSNEAIANSGNIEPVVRINDKNKFRDKRKGECSLEYAMEKSEWKREEGEK